MIGPASNFWQIYVIHAVLYVDNNIKIYPFFAQTPECYNQLEKTECILNNIMVLQMGYIYTLGYNARHI